MEARLTFDQLNDNGCLNMLCCMLKLMSRDFQEAYRGYLEDPESKTLRKQYLSIRRDFLSSYFKSITNLNGQKIVSRLESIVEEDLDT